MLGLLEGGTGPATSASPPRDFWKPWSAITGKVEIPKCQSADPTGCASVLDAAFLSLSSTWSALQNTHAETSLREEWNARKYKHSYQRGCVA